MEKTNAGVPSADRPPGSARTQSFKVLAALTVVVLLVHLALLQASPMTLGLSPSAPRAFTTRTVEVAPAPLVEPVVPAAAVPPPRQSPAPARAEKPAPATLDRSESATQQAAMKAEAASTRPEDATLQDPPPAEAKPPVAATPPPSEPATPVKAYTVPGSVHLKYQVSANKFPFSLKGELQWKQDGETYDARLEFSAFGQSRIQTSRGQVTSEGLSPIRFSDKYRSEVAAHFNREKGKVTFSANTPDVPLLTGAQDHLSILVQLAALMAANPSHYPPATTLSFQAVGPRDAETWIFTVGSEETLDLPGGELRALKLVRTPRQEFGQKLELWLAPALGYLPARLKITESNGDTLDQKWLATEHLY